MSIEQYRQYVDTWLTTTNVKNDVRVVVVNGKEFRFWAKTEGRKEEQVNQARIYEIQGYTEKLAGMTPYENE